MCIGVSAFLIYFKLISVAVDAAVNMKDSTASRAKLFSGFSEWEGEQTDF